MGRPTDGSRPRRGGLCGVLLAAVLGIVTSGCPLPTNPCQRDIFCNAEPNGICIRSAGGTGYCAYPAKDCASMWRWSITAADGLREECVDPALVPRDGGVDGMSTDGN